MQVQDVDVVGAEPRERLLDRSQHAVTEEVPFAAGLAAATITDDQLAVFTATLESVDEHTAVEELVSHDLKFHRLITEASANAYIASLLESMSSATIRARIWRGITQDHATERTLREHAAILDALRAHDAERTIDAPATHVGGIIAWVRSAL